MERKTAIQGLLTIALFVTSCVPKPEGKNYNLVSLTPTQTTQPEVSSNYITSPDTGAIYQVGSNGCIIVGKTTRENPQTVFGAARALGYPQIEVEITRNGILIGNFGGDTRNIITTENIGVYQPGEMKVCIRK